MGSDGGELLSMKEETVIITARAVRAKVNLNAARMSGLNLTPQEIESGDFYSRLILGIIENVGKKLNMKILQTEFFRQNSRVAILARGDISSINCDLNFLRESLEMAGKKMDVTIKVQKEDLFRYMHRI